MNGNSFGNIFRVTTWGESHGTAIGAIIDGCPSGLSLSPEDFLPDMLRRKGGGQNFTTARAEDDSVLIESGVFEGKTTGTPISLRIENKNIRSADYEEFRHIPRPGHADFTTHIKQEHRDHRGGGRSSARETAARVAAGVVAKKLLTGVEIFARVNRVGPYVWEETEIASMDSKRKLRDSSPLFLLADEKKSSEILSYVEKLKTAGDSWGGAIRVEVHGLPAGLGEPVFDKLNALLAHALMSLPAAVGCEMGGGISMSHLPGSAIRDPIGKNGPISNIHGGLLGGMTTGHPLLINIAFHAPTSVPRPIDSVDLRTGETKEIIVGGRHDSFPLPRAVPMVEAMIAITLADAYLRAGRIPENLGSTQP